MTDSERTTKRSLKKSSIKKEKKKISKKSKRLKTSSKKSAKESSSLNLSIKNKKNIEECLSHLESFLAEINTADLENLITEKNLEKLQKLTEIENIQVDLFLIKIYNKILSSENFFKDYFADHDDNDMKIGLVFIIIDEAIKILENLEDNVISSENFELKGNILRFIKFMKINLKDDMDNEDKKQIDSYMEELPNQFYSSNYLEIMKYKSKIYKNNYELLKNIENIDELFSGLESYYEQLSAIESLFNDIELETKDKLDKNNYISVSNKDIKSKKKKKKKSRVKDDSDDNEETDISNPKEQPEKITDEELINYGQFIINICIYQKFHLIQKPKKKINNKQNKKKNQKLKQKQKKIKRRKKSVEEEEEEEEEEENEEEEDEKENEDNDKENEIKNKEFEEEEEESEDDPEDVINLFVIDAVKNVNGRIQQKSNENIEISELIEDKYCISLMERKNLFEILKKNIENFKNLTKKNKNPEIKKIKLRFDSYIKSIEEDNYIPINKDNIHSIKYYNNFINNTIVVPNRDSKVLYVENTENQRGLLMIEFYLTDVSKDIIFTINRYDTESELFNQIYTSEKTNKKCKLCIYFEEKSLYQLEFINDYSWFNSKEVNFSISLFKILDEKEAEIKDNINNINNDINTNNKNDMENNKEKEENNEIKISQTILNNKREIKFYCHNDNMNYTFNCNKIYKKIKEYQKLEKNNPIQNNNKFSIQVYLNKIRFITIDENNKIKISEIPEEKENIITKNFFNKTILDYLNEHYIQEKEKENEKDKKVSINLFCLNKNLSQISPKIKELISALEDYSINNGDQFENQVYIQFLQKLGFYPDKKIANYEIKYNLFDFTDQCLIYHLFLNHIQEKPVESSTLVMVFEKDALHMTSLNEGAINDKFKEIEKNWKSRYYSKMKMNDFKSICNFISSLSDTFDGLDLVLCHYNNEEKKEEYDNMFKLIKGFVEEKIDEPINVYVYNEDNFIVHILKYIEMFSEE